MTEQVKLPDVEQFYAHEGSEIALLGMLMTDPRAVHDIASIVSPADFYNQFYREIFHAIRHLVYTEGTFDAAALEQMLIANNPDTPPAKWLPMLIMLRGAYAGTPEQIKRHALTISQKAVRRRMATLPDLFVALSQDSTLSIEEMMARAENLVYGLRGGTLFQTETLQEAASRYIDDLGKRFNARADAPRIMSGFTDYDRVLWGFRAGKHHIIAARPSVGKSTLALDLAENIAKDPSHRVLLFSIEMDDEELPEKRLSAHSGVDLKKFTFTSQMTEIEYQRALTALAHVSDNLVIDYNPESSIDYITSVAMREHAKNPISVIIIDHFHRIQMTERTGQIAEDYNRTTKKLSILYKKLRVAGITLAQLNRQSELRGDKRPVLADLKGTGGLEEEAYTVTFIHRDKSTPEIADLIVEKNRGGPTGLAQLRFDLQHSRFVQLARPGVDYNEVINF